MKTNLGQLHTSATARVAIVVVAVSCSENEPRTDRADDAGVPPPNVGDPCIPSWEYCPWYNGAIESVAEVAPNSPRCTTGECLQYHFRGRVSCPLGNLRGVDAPPVRPIAECVLPGSDDEIDVPVRDQCAERKDAVYCTCQCDGPDPNGQYCECPDGFSCASLNRIQDLNPGTCEPGPVRYCVRSDDAWSYGERCSTACASEPTQCGYTGNMAPHGLEDVPGVCPSLVSMGILFSSRLYAMDEDETGCKLEVPAPADGIDIPEELLPPDDRIPCAFVELAPPTLLADGSLGCAPCEGARLEPSCFFQRDVMSYLVSTSVWGEELAAGTLCACEILQLQGPELLACLGDTNPPPGISGWCWVDVEKSSNANPALLESCDIGSRHRIRFLGEDVPRADGVGAIWSC
jgi:hypothetical protein